MQSYILNLGKTKAEIQALTEVTDLGDMIYNPEKKIAYEKEWHTIIPTSVIKPEINGTELDYHYNETKLNKSKKFCAQLFWKAGLVISEGTSSDMATAKQVLQSSGKRIGGVNFNQESGLIDSFFYTKGALSSNGMNPFTSASFGISEELAQILDVSEIRATLKKIPSLQQSTPDISHSYIYGGTQSYITSTGNSDVASVIKSSTSTGGDPSTVFFGHPVSGIYDISELIKVVDDGSELQLSYSQPESNVDRSFFYTFATATITDTAPDYISKYFPQALPIGVPMVIAPAFVTTGSTTSSTLKYLVTPFIFYMLGITEVPEES